MGWVAWLAVGLALASCVTADSINQEISEPNPPYSPSSLELRLISATIPSAQAYNQPSALRALYETAVRNTLSSSTSKAHKITVSSAAVDAPKGAPVITFKVDTEAGDIARVAEQAARITPASVVLSLAEAQAGAKGGGVLPTAEQISVSVLNQQTKVGNEGESTDG